MKPKSSSNDNRDINPYWIDENWVNGKIPHWWEKEIYTEATRKRYRAMVEGIRRGLERKIKPDCINHAVKR